MVCRTIDLRSDTVTLPTEEMLRAMTTAELGDDILGEDPTVHKLEELGASIFGKEASLLLISGTMANQVAVMTFTRRGQEVIVGRESHIYNLEVAALAALSQVQPWPLSCASGFFDPVEVENAIQLPGIQKATTGLICIENTYDLNRGFVMSLENTKEVSAIGKKYGIPVYLDGGRIFNAALFLGRGVDELSAPADVVQVCLTKGLSAPLGSLLIGRKDFIEEARRNRQCVGGGMRQAGVIAAAGIVALTKMVDRLLEDHENAQVLARGLKEIDERLLDYEVQTNIVSIDVSPLGIDGDCFLDQVMARGIKIKKIGPDSFRMVCHYGIGSEDVDQVLVALRDIIKGNARA